MSHEGFLPEARCHGVGRQTQQTVFKEQALSVLEGDVVPFAAEGLHELFFVVFFFCRSM